MRRFGNGVSGVVTLHDNATLTTFLERVTRARERALLLDYDGTLAPFQHQRDQAYPYPGVAEALNAILRTGQTRVVVISGRQIDDLVPLLRGVQPLPELWGTHGWERRTRDGGVHVRPLPAAAEAALESGRAWVEEEELAGRCEFKPASIAVHWRGLGEGERAALERRVRDWMTPLTDGGAVALHSFDGGVELRAGGADKGHAVRALLGEVGTEAAVAYAGDDLTDEDAFEALDGRGLRVLVRAEPRDTLADIRLRPPDELLDFLRAWKRAIGGR